VSGRELKDYRELLRDELERRQRGNPHYSLRAFARDLDTAPSRISEVINHRRGLSPAAATRIATRLGYEPDEVQVFTQLVAREHARSATARQAAADWLEAHQAQRRQAPLAELTRTQVAWYHAALLEACRLPDMLTDLGWLARRLGVQTFQVRNALRWLKRLKFVREEGGRWIASKDVLPTPRRGLPKRMFQLELDGVARAAAQARAERPADPGEHAALVLAFDEAQLPAARALIDELQRDLARLSARARTPNRIYCLAVQLFGLDHPSSTDRSTS
jgi:uncharacterized protein (TIGR02147 family)